MRSPSLAAREIGRALGVGRDAAAEGHLELVAGLVPEAVVVGLEMIGIDHQEAERCAGALRAPPLARQRLVEMPPVRQPGQAVGARLQRQRLLGFDPPRELAAQPPLEKHGSDHQERGDEAENAGVAQPRRVDLVAGEADAEDQRQMADLPVGEEAAEVQAGIGVARVRDEEVLVAERALRRIERARVEHDRAAAVEHQDRAHVFRRGGAVEQQSWRISGASRSRPGRRKFSTTDKSDRS